MVSSAMIEYVIGPGTSGVCACPRRSGTYTRKPAATRAGTCANQDDAAAKPPCSSSTGWPSPLTSCHVCIPPTSMYGTRSPSHSPIPLYSYPLAG